MCYSNTRNAIEILFFALEQSILRVQKQNLPTLWKVYWHASTKEYSPFTFRNEDYRNVELKHNKTVRDATKLTIAVVEGNDPQSIESCCGEVKVCIYKVLGCVVCIVNDRINRLLEG